MSSENNIQLVQYLHYHLNQRNLAVIDAVFAPDYVIHGIAPGAPNGIAATKSGFEVLWRAFPNLQTAIEMIVADGSKVAYIEQMSGTQTGPLAELPATGKPIRIRTAGLYEIRDGRIIASWSVADTMTMFRQLQSQA